MAESRLFIQHLENYNAPKKIIKIAAKIEFKGILELFDNHFESLWEKLAKTNIETEIKQEFRDNILQLIRQSAYNILYLGIKDTDIKQLDFEELNRGIQTDFDKILQNLFNVFNVQYQLTLLQEKHTRKATARTSEPERIIKRPKEKTVREHLPRKQREEKTFKTEDIPHYEKVMEVLEEIKKNGEQSSMRQAALKVAKENIGLTEKNELQDFYNRFVNYMLRKKKNQI
ncbi:MAG TPA: hypothetical protein VI230_07430 [Ignavibacteriaceae bacterium]